MSWCRLGVLLSVCLAWPFLEVPAPFGIRATFTLLGTIVAYCFFVHVRRPYERYGTMTPIFVITCLDTLLVSGWILVTGAALSPFYVVFYPAAARVASRHGYVTTYIVVFAFAVFFLSGGAALGQLRTEMISATFKIVSVFLAAAVTAGLTEEIVERSRALEAANRNLEQEVAERQIAQEALAEAAKRKDEFLAMLAHELRNPLAPIDHALSLMDDDFDEDCRLHATAIIRRQLSHLTRMVDDLLDVSRVTRGKIQLVKTVVDLREVVTNAAQTCMKDVLGNGLRLLWQAPTTPIYAYVDVTRIEQVLVNLLRNAIKYSHKNGLIEITATTAGSSLALTVRDTGIGMEPAFIHRAFDLFAQADKSLDRTKGGLGIGLTLVKYMIEMHGGKVEASSDGPNKGSAFKLVIPLVAPPVMQRDPACVAVSQPHRRILLVEDNLDAAHLLGVLLKRWGHTVEVVNTGDRALSAAADFGPDVILLDIGLPGMSGYEIARALRADPEFDDTKLVAITGYGGADDREEAFQAGFDLHLTKPVRAEKLSEILGSTFGVPVMPPPKARGLISVSPSLI